MAVNTYDMAPAMTGERTEGRSDMFAQSSALYGRINKSANRGMSPWMIIAPIAVAVLAGGALIATAGSHPKQTARAMSNAPAAQALTSAPKSAATAPQTPAQALKVTAAPQKAPPAAHTVPTRAPTHQTVAMTRVSHARPAPVARTGTAPAANDVHRAAPAPAPAATAPSVITAPTPIVPAPAPDAAPATTAPPAADPAPANPPGV